MKRVLFIMALLVSVCTFAQSWQGKPIVRIEDKSPSIMFVFSDSSTAYVKKANVSYIVNFTGSQWVQMGYMYEGATSKIITFSYSSITAPHLESAKLLSDTLNVWIGR